MFVRPSRAWPALRASLIGLVLLSQAIDAFPLPIFQASQLKQPVGRQELKRWQGLLSSMGISMSTEALSESVLSVSDRARALEATVQAPLNPLRPLLGIDQSWSMFAFVDPDPGGLVIDLQTADGSWEAVYPSPSRGARLARQLRYRRLRAVYDAAGDRARPGKLYTRFASWAAGALFAAEPDAMRVRLRMRYQPVRLPWEDAASVRFTNEILVSRGAPP